MHTARARNVPVTRTKSTAISGRDQATERCRRRARRVVASGRTEAGRNTEPGRYRSSQAVSSELASSDFPVAAKRDPEGEENEAQIEPETLVRHVDQVVLEFVPSWNVA